MGLGEIIHDWQDRRRAVAEVAAMTARELRDLGLERSELEQIAAMPAAQIVRLDRMAEAFGATRALEARPDLRSEVARTCARCGHTAECAAEMARDGGPRADHADFCPNAPTYRALAAE